ncbi:MAG TPA: TetR family transcriptional regulator [Cellulomonas sp.]
MSNTSGARRLTPDERREQILVVASAHLERHGYDGASIGAIAGEVGVTRALVHHYFPGKSALLEAVLRRESDALLRATAPDPAATPRQNVERAVDAYLDHFAAAAGGLRDLYRPHATSPAVVWELTTENHGLQVQRVREALALADSARTRVAIGAWLAFVEQVARHAVDEPDLSRRDALDLCTDALRTATGHPFP